MDPIAHMTYKQLRRQIKVRTSSAADTFEPIMGTTRRVGQGVEAEAESCRQQEGDALHGIYVRARNPLPRSVIPT